MADARGLLDALYGRQEKYYAQGRVSAAELAQYGDSWRKRAESAAAELKRLVRTMTLIDS